MRSRIRNSFEVLSMSALDLFASALGIFVIITFVLLPFYLRQPTVEEAIAGARAELADVTDEINLLQKKLVASQSASSAALSMLASAQRRLADARSAMPRAGTDEPAPPVPDRRPGSLSIPPLDVVIVIDTTGSMRDELRELQAGLLGIVRILHRLSPSLAVGVVAYRDHGGEYLTRGFPLVSMNDGTVRELLNFVDALRTAGGGDDPEALDAGLAAAMTMAWRERTAGRVIVISDQPPHPANLQTTLDVAARFHSADPLGRQVGTIYVGDEEDSARRFFERLAAAGGGDFRVHRGEMIESILLSAIGGNRKR